MVVGFRGGVFLETRFGGRGVNFGFSPKVVFCFPLVLSVGPLPFSVSPLTINRSMDLGFSASRKILDFGDLLNGVQKIRFFGGCPLLASGAFGGSSALLCLHIESSVTQWA
jgi:hypothetical protein